MDKSRWFGLARPEEWGYMGKEGLEIIIYQVPTEEENDSGEVTFPKVLQLARG